MCVMSHNLHFSRPVISGRQATVEHLSVMGTSQGLNITSCSPPPPPPYNMLVIFRAGLLPIDP